MATDDQPDLDDLTRAQLAETDETAYEVAMALDDWRFAEHGILSSSHGAGHFLELLAARGYRVERIEAPAFEGLLPAAKD